MIELRHDDAGTSGRYRRKANAKVYEDAVTDRETAGQ